ncbi:hypothetical protein [Zavarzinella formosa]|uniref:hypothetical protein n=1 Tax=Zavarzinella formosa TaxID=360055 RepID=UPI0002E46945|nr:hypothetical protein [Zavarzinella formosa]
MPTGHHQRACAAGAVIPARVVPAGPAWISQELVDATIRVWQPYYEEPLTPEEAVTMIQNMGRLFQALSPGSS